MAAGKAKVDNDNDEKVGTPLKSSEKKKKKALTSSADKALMTPTRRSTRSQDLEATTKSSNTMKVSKEQEAAVKDKGGATKDVVVSTATSSSKKQASRKQGSDDSTKDLVAPSTVLMRTKKAPEEEGSAVKDRLDSTSKKQVSDIKEKVDSTKGLVVSSIKSNGKKKASKEPGSAVKDKDGSTPRAKGSAVTEKVDSTKEEVASSKKTSSKKKAPKEQGSAEKEKDIHSKDVIVSPNVKSPKRRKRKKSVELKDDASPRKNEKKRSEDDDEDMDVNVIYDDTPNDDEEGDTLEVTSKEAPPMMSVKMHRMRFLKFQPQAVLTMAATPHDPKASDYVAVSREAGCVELKSPDEKFRTLAKIAGLKSKSVDVMDWVVCQGSAKDTPENKISYATDFHKSLTEIHAQRTLIGGSKDGTIFVIDFSKGGYEAVTGSGGGGVFSLATLSGSNLIAAGCEDGSVRIYKVDRDSKTHRLDLVSIVPSAGSAVLSLAWSREKGCDVVGMGGTVLFAGIADGTIRRYECVSAATHARSKGAIMKDISSSLDYGKQTWSSKMRMTVESYGRTTPTRVWALKALSDGTLISGDSLGHVQFWDAKTGTLLQSFEQNDMKADTLALAVSPDESHVFASGIDSRIICIQRSLDVAAGDPPSRWIMTYAQRPHTHDVKALVICHVHSKSGSLAYSNQPKEIICSGGVDTKICSCNIRSFKLSRPNLWFPWPTQTPISIARKARVLLMRREDSLELHQLGPKEIDSLPLVLHEEDNFIGSMDIQSSHNLMCSDISQDGKFVVASTGSLLLLFKIEYIENHDGTPGFAPKQVPLKNSCKSPCLAVKFLKNDLIACASNEGPLHLLKITDKAEVDSYVDDGMDTDDMRGVDVSLIHSFEDSNQSGHSMFGIHSIVVSEDGQQFATVRSGVGSGTVLVFDVIDDKIKKYWAVSALEAPISVAAFLLGRRKLLAVACSNFAVYVFDLEGRKLSEWSEKNGFPLTPSLPQELNRSFDYPLRIIPNPKTPERFVVGAFGSFCVINMAEGIPKRSRLVPEMKLRGRKRKRHVAETTVDPNYGNFTLCLRYNSMIHMDYVDEDELLVVEQPWLSVVANFPAALERKVYGT